MTPSEQIERLSDEIDALIGRYRDEYDLTYAAVIGVLFAKAHFLCEEAKNQAGEEEE